jgi:hypothetical protein
MTTAPVRLWKANKRVIWYAKFSQTFGDVLLEHTNPFMSAHSRRFFQYFTPTGIVYGEIGWSLDLSDDAILD